MTRRLATALVTLLLVEAAIGGCAAAPRQTPPPVTLIPGPILTFPWVREQVACPAFAAVDPLHGIFEGDPTRSSQAAWLRSPDGRELVVAWPEGFSVRFEPNAVLYDDRARIVARHGDRVELGQVNVGDHAGTHADPYLAEGLVVGGCYARAG